MMKIKSVVDVITNSSTEVFTLRTGMTLEEVKKILQELLPDGGYCDPEILTPEKGVLNELIDFGYVFDKNNKSEIAKYKLGEFNETHKLEVGPDGSYRYVEVPGAAELQKAWGEFVYKNRDRINKAYVKKNKYADKDFEFIPDYLPACASRIDKWEFEYLPDGIVDEFLSEYKGPLPETLEVPEEYTIDYWKGRIGFSGSSDNSIPGDAFDAINQILNGTNWHMG